MWQTRAEEGKTTPIDFITPAGGRKSIRASHYYSDWRDLGNSSNSFHSIFNMAAEVTDIVQNAGFGWYSVCNIPRWEPDAINPPGGESPGSWQLIIVEEAADYPVRVVSLMMGSDFRLQTNYETVLDLGIKGLKSKVNGAAGGQIFFGATNSGADAFLTENFYVYNENGDEINKYSRITDTPGLYKNGDYLNDRDKKDGCIRMSLSDIGNIGNGIRKIKLLVENKKYSTFLFLGMSADIAFSDFSAVQNTVVNSAASVTVSGRIQNISSISNTGIYYKMDGSMPKTNLKVNLDEGLVPISSTAVINGTTVIQGRTEGNDIVFENPALASVAKGCSITYTIECATNNSGKTVFRNSDNFSGYLRSDGAYTDFFINQASVSSSQGIPKYSVTVQGGTGIQSVSRGGDYTYGTAVAPGAILKPGYHWKTWSGSYTTPQLDFSFPMPSGNITLTASGEPNTYRIVFHANGGGVVNHLTDIAAKYDEEVSLPNGAEFYQRFTLDGMEATGENGHLSVFMGWSLEAGKSEFVPKWKAGNVIKNLTEKDGEVVNLYAIWDDCPWMKACS